MGLEFMDLDDENMEPSLRNAFDDVINLACTEYGLHNKNTSKNFPYTEKMNIYVRACLEAMFGCLDYKEHGAHNEDIFVLRQIVRAEAILTLLNFSPEEQSREFVHDFQPLVGIDKQIFDEWYVDASVTPMHIINNYNLSSIAETKDRPNKITWSYWHIPITTGHKGRNALLTGLVLSFISLVSDNFRNGGLKDIGTNLFNPDPDRPILIDQHNRTSFWRGVDSDPVVDEVVRNYLDEKAAEEDFVDEVTKRLGLDNKSAEKDDDNPEDLSPF